MYSGFDCPPSDDFAADRDGIIFNGDEFPRLFEGLLDDVDGAGATGYFHVNDGYGFDIVVREHSGEFLNIFIDAIVQLGAEGNHDFVF